MDRVAILIRTKDEAESLPATLNVLMSQTRAADEIIVVDSGSTDDTVDIVRSFSNLRLIEIDLDPFSYGGSLNLGFSSTACDFVACLSAHALPMDGFWLEELLRPCADPRVAGVYGRQVPRSSAYPSYRRDLEGYYGDSPRVQNVPTEHVFSNANSLIRRRAWIEVRFDENLPYCEDQLWARTVIGNGYSIAYAPAAAVMHSHNENLREVVARSCREELAWRMIGESDSHSFRSSLRESRRKWSADIRYIRSRGYGPPWFVHSLLYRLAQSIGRMRAHRLPLPRESSCA
jgi:rhamnosyltransferase